MEEKDVYHYTSMRGFHNIIESQTLRFTRSDFMNDSKECSLFYELMKKENNKVLLKDDISADLETIIEKYSLFEHLKQIEKHMNYYIFSLTGKSDNLPMWNYYGNNGVQLQLDKDKLVQVLKQSIKENFNDNFTIIEGAVQYMDSNSTIGDLDEYHYRCCSGKKENISYKESLRERNQQNDFYKEGEGEGIDNFIYSAKKDLQVTLDFLLKNHYISKDEEPENIFKQIYKNCHDQKDRHNKMKFKWEIILNLIALSTLTKIDSYKNEDEFRIVIVNEKIEDNNDDEEYYIANTNDIDFIKPCLIVKNIDISQILKGVVLSPAIKNLPIEEEKYKKTVESYLKKECKENVFVDVSNHMIRW